MKKAGKYLSILVAFSMIFAFVACAQTEEEPDETTAVTTTATTTAAATTTTARATTTAATTTQEELVSPFAEFMEISWLVGIYSSHLYVDGRWDQRELEEKFNIKLNMWNVLVHSGQMEQVEMMLAAGDVPDYGFYYKSGINLYPDGLSRTIPEEAFRQWFPSYYAFIEEDPIIRYMATVPDPEDPHYGEYYGVSMITPMPFTTFNHPMFRLDWLEDLGWQLDNITPVVSYAYPEYSEKNVFLTSTVFTVDELTEIFRAFTEDDPDNNGMDDTFGSAWAGGSWDQYNAWAIFGFDRFSTHRYQDPMTGDYVPFYAYTPYRDYLMYVTDMLERGYYVRVPGQEPWPDEMKAMWATGKIGYFSIPTQRILGYAGDAPTYPPQTILDEEPDARMVITRPPGAGKWRPHQMLSWGYPNQFLIGEQVDDNKLERIFHLIEYSFFGENWVRYKWGIEGVHFTWAGEAFDSPLIFTPEDQIPAMYRGVGTTTGFGQFGNTNFIKDMIPYFSYCAMVTQLVNFWNTHHPEGFYDHALWIRPDKHHSSFTMPADLFEEMQELVTEYQGDINTIHNDFVNRVFDGQVANIRVEWEQYIESLYAAGLEHYVRVFNDDHVKTFGFYAGLE